MKIIFLSLILTSTLYARDLESYLFVDTDKGMKTEQFLLTQSGKLVFEKYEQGDINTRHLLWSMSKSISSLIFGIAEDKGYISRDDSLDKYFSKEISQFSKSKATRLKKIKIKNMLEMTSGFDWNEFYESSPFNSHVVRMLYFASKKSVTNYILKTDHKYKAGKRFYYSSGDSNIYTSALRRALPEKLKDTYPWEFFFDPLEMQASFEKDKEGVFLASSYIYLSTKDLLKLGEFILNKGVYKGKQIISKSYLEYAISLNEPHSKGNCKHPSGMTYGAQFWLNKICPGKQKNYKDAPEDMIMLLGHGGQSVFIFPTQKAVAVRIARDKNNALDKNLMAKLILEKLKSKK